MARRHFGRVHGPPVLAAALALAVALLLAPAANATITWKYFTPDEYSWMQFGSGSNQSAWGLNDGLMGAGVWANSGAIGWDVDYLPAQKAYRYDYEFQLWGDAAAKRLSFFALEVSSDMAQSELSGLSANFDYSFEFGDFNIPNAQGLVPFDHGMKLNLSSGAPADGHYRVTFITPRPPQWGDFYAKDGMSKSLNAFNAIWNAGYTKPDLDPPAITQTQLIYPKDVGWHIVRPDSSSGSGHNPVPEPSSLLLMGLAAYGGTMMTLRRRRRDG